MMNISEELNPAQKEAVRATAGPVLILAGAGAGKTKTITHRILHLIHHGTDPEKILAITFTNKAASEMKERVENLLAKDEKINRPAREFAKPFVSTFHALGVRILKENSELIKMPRHFAIFDRTDSKRALKEALETAGLGSKQFDPGKILSIISREKGSGINIERYEESGGDDYMRSVVASAWRVYEKILERERAFDFDDLLLKTSELLERSASVREHYQKTWSHIHVDEYQDTNAVQYKMTRLLTNEKNNICVVGDIDQMIYGWRGASLRNILNFERDYPGAVIIMLEENYRSTKTIIAAANTIIKKNVFRREKNLFTNNPAGEKITLSFASDEADEAESIADKVSDLVHKGASAREIAVLYRANFQSRVLEEAFLERNISYQLVGTRFFERKEIKDILSFLKAALNPESRLDIKRITNLPPRGIGKITLLKIFEGRKNDLPAAMKQKVESFFRLLENIAGEIKIRKPSETVKYIIKKTGLDEHLGKQSDEDIDRLENMRELVTLAKKYDSQEPLEGIEALISAATLASDQDALAKNEQAVKLMTVHASKGLEFDYVFISGLEQDLFPHAGPESSAGSEDSEEERRLFYVALTRARKKLMLSAAGMRTIYGNKQFALPSEFIADIPEKYIEYDERVAGEARKPLVQIEF